MQFKKLTMALASPMQVSTLKCDMKAKEKGLISQFNRFTNIDGLYITFSDDYSQEEIESVLKELIQSPLRLLYLHAKNLTSISEVFSKLRKIQFLNLKGCRIKTIEGLPKNCKELNLSENELTVLPEIKSIVSSIQVMNLSKNNLVDIDKTIVLFDQLNKVILDDNKLTHFPDILLKLTELKSIGLNNNPLSEEEKERCQKDYNLFINWN